MDRQTKRLEIHLWLSLNRPQLNILEDVVRYISSANLSQAGGEALARFLAESEYVLKLIRLGKIGGTQSRDNALLPHVAQRVQPRQHCATVSSTSESIVYQDKRFIVHQDSLSFDHGHTVATGTDQRRLRSGTEQRQRDEIGTKSTGISHCWPVRSRLRAPEAQHHLRPSQGSLQLQVE